jgi:hypothetical protein
LTIIAFKDGIMAADSVEFYGERRAITATPKIVRRRFDGALVGCAGDCDVIEAALAWIMGDGPKPTMVIKPGDFSAVLALPDGRVFHVPNTLLPYEVSEPFVVGSDSAELFTMGALKAGATAKHAVRLCTENIRTTGGPVQVERLAPTGITKAHLSRGPVPHAIGAWMAT